MGGDVVTSFGGGQNRIGQCTSDSPTGSESWSGIPVQQVIKNGIPMLMAMVRMREEKGSDVNVATHLLADVFRR